MLLTFGLALVQIDGQTSAQLSLIGWLLIVIASVIVLCLIVGLVVALGALRTMNAANRVIARADSMLHELSPRAAPLLDRITRIAGDAQDITDVARRRVTNLMDTVADLNDSLKDASTEAERRVREFAAVLDVVQAEAERLLLDTAATASGISRTAERLQARRAPPSGRREVDGDLEGTELAESGSVTEDA